MSIAVVMTALVECVCEGLEAAGRPATCFCGILPGDSVPADYVGTCDDCGMAWVRLVASAPAVGLSTSGLIPPTDSTCAAGVGFNLEVGILRCAPLGENGEAPDPDEMSQAAIDQMDDLEAIYKAIVCCGIEDIAVLGYAPVGPEGGVIGGAWSVAGIVF